MTRDAILAKVRDTLAEIIDQDTLQLTDATSADEVPYWDSINHVKLLIGLESELGIRFETDEISGLKNVGELVDVIERKIPG